jgi:hypothetical protein
MTALIEFGADASRSAPTMDSQQALQIAEPATASCCIECDDGCGCGDWCCWPMAEASQDERVERPNLTI